ncbi:MAG: diacylglycerol/lipid kinase family protein [Candidatus Anammoxibacter sp.]
MKKRLKVIFNPVSGLGLSEKRLEMLIWDFRNHNYDVELLKTCGKGDAGRFAAGTDDTTSVIVVIGGDGTINEVVNGLQGTHIPIGIIPRGTANVLAKELGISRNIKKACRVICKGKTICMDLGYDFKKYFFLMAGIGIDAEVVNYLDSARKGNITSASYGIPIVKAVSRYSFPDMTIEVDGKLISQKATCIFVSNVKGYIGPAKFTYLAKVNDGQFDICIIKAKRRCDLPKYIFGAVTRTLHNFSDVIYLRGKDVKITSESDALYQLDGDPGGSLPARFRLMPNAVKFLAP